MNREAWLALSMLFVNCTFIVIGVLLVAGMVVPTLAGGLLVAGGLAMTVFTAVQYHARQSAPRRVPVRVRRTR